MLKPAKSALLVGHYLFVTSSPAATTNLPGRIDVAASAALPPSTTVRTLAIRLQPEVGESIESWLEAWAARSGATWGEMLVAVGLHRGSRNVRIPHFTVSPTPQQVATVSYTTGVSASVISAMTLTSLFATTDSAMPATVVLPRSRFCPRCLADSGGRWQSWWRLRWSFACPLHRCLLADACSQCGRHQRVQSHPQSLIPQPGLCAHPAADIRVRSQRRCGATLSTVDTIDLADNYPALALQREIITAMTTGWVRTGIYTQSPITALQFIADLTALGQRIIRYACAEDLRARVPQDLWNIHERTAVRRAGLNRRAVPRAMTYDSSATVAVAAWIAAPIVQAPSVEAAGERLRWLIEAMRADGLRVSASKVGWGRAVSTELVAVQLAAMARYLGPTDQLRYRTSTAQPRRPARHQPIHRSVPAWLWPRWAFRVSADGVGADQVRSALSVALLTVGAPIDLNAACALLGSVTGYAVSRVLAALWRQNDWATTACLLIDLADALGGGLSPIDYHQRRHLPLPDLLPERQWLQFCRTTHTPVNDPHRAQLCRWWLYERLTGSPARQHPQANESQKFWRTFATLPVTLTPLEVSALDECGRAVLDRHGMGDEPLRWQPPADALANLAHHTDRWPLIDVPQLHRLIRVNHLPMGLAARALGCSIDVIRETLNDYPAARVPRAATGAAIARARSQLSRDRYIELHHHQGRPLWAIAVEAEVSLKSLRHLAREYGMVLRPPS